MAPRRPSPAQIRDRRARTTAVVLGGVLLIVGVVQGPKILSMVQGGSSSGAPSSPGASATAAGATPSGTNVAFSSAAAVGPVAGQLDGFSLLAPKDPFHSQLPTTASPGLAVPAPAVAAAVKKVAKQPAAGVSVATTIPAAAGVPGAATPAATAVPGAATPAAGGVPAAVLKMNGHKQVVAKGGRFPLASPLFDVVSVGKRRASIMLVTGSFADGSRTLKLRRGHKITLLNTTDGSRYVLLFLSLTRAAPVVATAPASSTSGG